MSKLEISKVSEGKPEGPEVGLYSAGIFLEGGECYTSSGAFFEDAGIT